LEDAPGAAGVRGNVGRRIYTRCQGSISSLGRGLGTMCCPLEGVEMLLVVIQDGQKAGFKITEGENKCDGVVMSKACIPPSVRAPPPVEEYSR